MVERPELDGLRLREIEGPNIWLVFQGRRRRIENPAVYDSLFGNVEQLLEIKDIHDIAMGPELNDGTCLVRAAGSMPIYLVTGFPEVVRYLVPSYEILVDFGFDLTKVWDVPSIILDAVAMGPELESAADRRRRAA